MTEPNETPDVPPREPPLVEVVVRDETVKDKGSRPAVAAFFVGTCGAVILGLLTSVFGKNWVVWFRTPSARDAASNPCFQAVTDNVERALLDFVVTQGVMISLGFVIFFSFTFFRLRRRATAS